MPICEYGCGKSAIHRFSSSGRWCCSRSTSSCEAMKSRNSVAVKDFQGSLSCIADQWKNGHPRGNSGKSTLGGKNYVEMHGLKEAERIRNQISETTRRNRESDFDRYGGFARLSGTEKEEHIKRCSERIKARYEAGWMPKAGRSRKISYHSCVAGDVNLDGTWELIAAKYLDRIGVSWKRNSIRFAYVDTYGTHRFYTPDFWVEEWNSFVEVKGYETDLDRCKWSQFKANLIIWKSEEIKRIKEDGQDGNAAVC